MADTASQKLKSMVDGFLLVPLVIYPLVGESNWLGWCSQARQMHLFGQKVNNNLDF